MKRIYNWKGKTNEMFTEQIKTISNVHKKVYVCFMAHQPLLVI